MVPGTRVSTEEGRAGATTEPVEAPVPPWARSAEDVLRLLAVSSDQGLTSAEVARRLRDHGANQLREFRRRSAWHVLGGQFKSLVVGLLVAATAVSMAFGEWVEGLAIGAVILINALIGFVTEMRAVRSMEALRRLGSVTARVRRAGRVQEVPAKRLVPGDIVILQGGDVVTADLRLIEASKLQADESSLTGESLPVGKGLAPADAGAPLADRSSMVFKGTSITRGSGAGVAVGTGMRTELGRIAALVEEADDEVTPLEKRLAKLGQTLIWVTLVIAAATSVTGILSGEPVLLMIETGIALAVAAIPEGLPIVATIALARGMWRMARRNALVNRLAAVETLGATNVILTDKTGTLTENRLTVSRFALPDLDVEVTSDIHLTAAPPFTTGGRTADLASTPTLRAALEVALLCNNASFTVAEGVPAGLGDPLEVALLAAGARAGMERADLIAVSPEVREEAFDEATRMMATYHEVDGRVRVAVKGAAEAVLEACTAINAGAGDHELSPALRERWLNRNTELAARGLRVLALAEKHVDDVSAAPYERLTLLGLVGMLDPPRQDVRPALAACQSAGVRVVMATGDQPVTARNVALAVGLTDALDAEVAVGRELPDLRNLSASDRAHLLGVPIFARVDPGQKLDLVALHQHNGAIVAMTGDGVNDAPALRKADIGVAMGRRGTQVAREAAEMVLRDDAFSSIVAAIQQGRVIFQNIRQFVVYLLSCNVSEVMTVSGAVMLGAPLPLLPLQILFLNLVTDVFPALALGLGDAGEEVMLRPPRSADEPILTRRHWATIVSYGLLITVTVLGALHLAGSWLGLAEEEAVTVSFLTLGFAQLWHVFNMRGPGSRFVANDVTRNRWVWGAVVLCTALLVLAVYLPGLSTVLGAPDPGPSGWLLVLAASLIPWAAGQLWCSLPFGAPAAKQ